MKRRGLLIVVVIASLLHSPINATFSQSLTSIIGSSKGHAVTADYEGLISIAKNPASVTQINQPQFKTHYTNHYGIIQKTMIAWGMPVATNSSIAITIPTQIIGNIQQRSNTGVYLGDFNDYLVTPMLIIGYKWQKLAIGSSIKYHYQHIATETGKGTALNLGLRYENEFVALGASVQDLLNQTHWSTGKQESESSSYHMGVMAHFNDHIILTDMDYKPNLKNWKLNIGYEILLTQRLKLQAGITDVTNTFKYGLGVNLMMSTQTEVNYSYSQHHVLGHQHSFGVTIAY